MEFNFFRKKHTARYESPATYHTYAFSLPDSIEIHKFADRLLKTGIANAAARSGGDEVRFAKRYRSTLKNRRLALSMASLADVENGELAFSKWALKNPMATLYLLRKRILRLSFSAEKSSPNPELLATLKELGETADELRDRVANAGLFVGTISNVDRSLFNSAYLQTEPFIRLELEVPGIESPSIDGTEVVPLLLLHRSGTALLSLVVTPGNNKTTDEIIQASAPSKILLTKTYFPHNIGGKLNLDDLEVEEDFWALDEEETDVWRSITWGRPLTLSGLFIQYAKLLHHLAGGDGHFGAFMCYSTMFIDRLACCRSRKQWLVAHRRELAGIITRHRGYALVKDSFVDDVLKPDHGLDWGTSSYFGPGSATFIDWDFDDHVTPSSPASHFHTTAVVDNALLQIWQLTHLDRKLSEYNWKPSNFTRMQKSIVLGLEEFRSSKIVWGTAQEVERAITSKHQLDRYYTHMIDRMNSVQQLISARSTQLANRRNVLLAGISAFAAVILGVPAVKEFLGVVQKLDTERFPGSLARPLKGLSQTGESGIWTSYLTLSCFVITVTLVTFFIRVRDARKPLSRDFGIRWGELSYTTLQQEYRDGKSIELDSDRKPTK